MGSIGQKHINVIPRDGFYILMTRSFRELKNITDHVKFVTEECFAQTLDCSALLNTPFRDNHLFLPAPEL